MSRVIIALLWAASIADCSSSSSQRRDSEWLRTANAPGVGEYLTDSSGRAVYMFAADGKNASACTGPCATAWPPLPAGGAKGAAEHSSDAVRVEMIRAISRDLGGRQTTYNGMPLYRYEDDERPGDIKGQGKNEFGGLWYLVSPDGKPIASSASSSAGKDDQ